MMEARHSLVGRSRIDFDRVRISIASPEKIKSWSWGEVTKPETINYRTFKPEKDGLFCAKIFGPINDYECLCGKYKRMKYRGIICERCGVEVTKAKVRRERMGHIQLASPVAHIWFFKSTPSRIGLVLDLTIKDLEKVLYFESYIVINPGDTPLKERQLLNEEEYKDSQEKYADKFEASIGAEAIKMLLDSIDINKEADRLRKLMKKETSQQRKLRHAKRLRVFKALKKSGNRPDWMILTIIPVIPPDLRPLVRLDGGRFATSDLNDLYRRVINRNNRLKKLIELKAPELIIRNEKRMLQEAVDALFDNGKRGRVHLGANRRPLKSLSEALRGKQGRFRQNLLGKRVDYSGRSVIVVGPELELNRCGLPKKMALELFKPFIFHKLEKEGLVPSVKVAREWHEQERPEVWDYLEEVVKEHPILLNRAPTLHRLGIQAFEPVLVEGKAIQIHPLVCAAFNADFDGDQMAVHIPLSAEAQVEAQTLMLSTQNILSPAHGRPLAIPSQDMVLGCYYLTLEKRGKKGEGRIFGTADEVLLAQENKEVSLHSPVKLKFDGPFMNLSIYYDDQAVLSCPVTELQGEIIETTPGRIIFNNILPKGVPFINGMLRKKGIENLVYYSYLRVGFESTIGLLDKMKELGFNYATQAGFSLGIDDFLIPKEKSELVEKAQKEVQKIENLYRDGTISAGERFNRVVEIWGEVTDKVSSAMIDRMREVSFEEKELNPLFVMADSGSRGNKQQIRQLAGMRGLMSKPSGEIIETPIVSNLREGLNVLQYFISTHGARKGLADTALKTANSGYLTRKLVDVAQEVIVDEHDCGTLKGENVSAIVENGELIEPFEDRIIGRTAIERVLHPDTNEVLVDMNQDITEEIVQKFQNLGIERVKIRSVLTCESKRGVCQLCYGRNMSTGSLVELGEAVGIIGAQSIGEPGTQLTMRTFHVGGIAMRGAERSRLEAKNDGIIRFNNLNSVVNKEESLIVVNRNANIAVLDHRGREIEHYQVPYGAKILVKDGEEVKARQEFAEWDPFSVYILTEEAGVIRFRDVVLGVSMEEVQDEFTGLISEVIIDPKDEKFQPQIEVINPRKKDEKGKPVVLRKYFLPSGAHLEIKDTDKVYAGDILAKIPREVARTKDITGGLPRAEELFEARRPKAPAVISEIDGTVTYGGLVRGHRKLTVHNERGGEKEYLIPKGAHLSVGEAERVKAGIPLMDGPVNPHDILKVLGEKELAEYLLMEIQAVYRLQGVSINDKHIEIIIRQMLRWVKVEEVGDTEFLVDEQVDKFVFQEENEKVIQKGGTPAKARPLLLGITKSALSTDSFISAASFQETTRVLTEASLYGKVDHLRRLKENIIMGRLIPAGTGYRYYNIVELTEEKEEETEKDIDAQIQSKNLL
ncbi:MAG: DNA-directed RNA polymerase subunit beta' [Candidatus Aminicenantes bacterium]|nr:MAG: DNA-directed RNA polymerase subunit beta' [Candidatus Aminicenantes bacterium]